MTLFPDHFSGVSAAYADYRPCYPEDLFIYLSSLPAQHDLALDCATGSGQAALPLARFFQTVVAADASIGQVSRSPQHPRVHYLVAAAEANAIQAAAVDLVTAAQALHWFRLPAFYAEVKRVLRPGGVMAVWSYGRLKIACGSIQERLDHFYDRIVGPYWPPQRRHVEEGYRTLDFPFEELRTPAFALTADWPLSHLAGYLRTWSATQLFIKAHAFDPVAHLLPQLAQHWGDPQALHKISWPIAIRVGIKP